MRHESERDQIVMCGMVFAIVLIFEFVVAIS